MVLGWFGGRGGPGTPATVAPVPRVSLDGVHCGPRLEFGLGGQFQQLDLRQIDPVNDGETRSCTPRAGLDQDALLQKVPDRPLDRALPKLRMPLDRALEHQMPEPSSLALSARNMMICLRVALPNFRSAQAFATRQLIGEPQKAHRRANFVQVLYEISAIFAEFGAKARGTFRALLRNAL